MSLRKSRPNGAAGYITGYRNYLTEVRDRVAASRRAGAGRL
jgi:hypothetical protein